MGIKIKIKPEIKADSVFRNWSFYLFATSFILMVFIFFLVGLYGIGGIKDSWIYYIVAVMFSISYFAGGILFLLFICLSIYEKFRKNR